MRTVVTFFHVLKYIPVFLILCKYISSIYYRYGTFANCDSTIGRHHRSGSRNTLCLLSLFNYPSHPEPWTLIGRCGHEQRSPSATPRRGELAILVLVPVVRTPSKLYVSEWDQKAEPCVIGGMFVNRVYQYYRTDYMYNRTVTNVQLTYPGKHSAEVIRKDNRNTPPTPMLSTGRDRRYTDRSPTVPFSSTYL